MYNKGQEVMLYQWTESVGGFSRKYAFGQCLATGAVRYLDGSTYYEIDLLDNLGCEWVHESNLEDYAEWEARVKAYEDSLEDGFMVEEYGD